MSFETISIFGLGYIGLPTAAVFASRKIKVIGVDVNQHAVDTINQGKIHIVEPDLDIAVQSAVTAGYLTATTQAQAAQAFIVAVPTPFKDDHKPDLSYIRAACEAIAPVLEKGNLVILESTSPVGATEQMASWLAEFRVDLTFPQTDGDNADINIAHCPERVLPGHVMHELVANDRIIGGMSETCAKRSVELYKTFVKGDCIVTNARTAEMAKLTENSFRDVNIAFANELSIICDKLDINVWELIQLANRHPRVNILQPGCGVGGHCIAVDPWFIVDSAPEHAKLIHTARLVNDSKPDWVVEKVKLKLAEFLTENPEKSAKDVTIACYGIAFKPNIDDLRESPALEITKEIADWFAGEVLVVEPNINELPKSLISTVTLSEIDSARKGADISVLLVKHEEFISIKDVLSTNNTIDTIGMLS
ncbi:UDP-N-acetyl-D-mannosamine dehydrogenase [Flocculibacter collagenilyticus]|uniref:UDP-N-acetyl-D-mannosamine dehydrogenase n=1 Tax=Flocculibacter collagenilyticus TaxID=2744479 RepID=UPI0018F3378D|nr:UDP-N-acetyl-D-mannosamine dehydrogenase [Flocculibacter collagenilyticus]